MSYCILDIWMINFNYLLLRLFCPLLSTNVGYDIACIIHSSCSLITLWLPHNPKSEKTRITVAAQNKNQGFLLLLLPQSAKVRWLLLTFVEVSSTMLLLSPSSFSPSKRKIKLSQCSPKNCCCYHWELTAPVNPKRQLQSSPNPRIGCPDDAAKFGSQLSKFGAEYMLQILV